MFGSLGAPEILLIVVVGLIVFGPSKLPEFGKSLGEAIRGFKKSLSDAEKTPLQSTQTDEKSDGSHKP